MKPAVEAVEHIHQGMTEAQVRAVLDWYFPPNGRFKRPDIGPVRSNVLSFVLDPHDGGYDAAAVSIHFNGDKCLSARFDPD